MANEEEQVKKIFGSQPRLADALYCVAGGTSTETGFFADISPIDLEQCMRKNYLTSAYSAHVMLQMWTEDDKESQNRSQQTPIHKVRQIVFVSSAAAFVGFPGYIAYTSMSAITPLLHNIGIGHRNLFSLTLGSLKLRNAPCVHWLTH